MKPHRSRKTNQHASTWPVSYRWLAVGTLAVYTAIGSKTINVAMAQTPTSANTATDLTIPPRRYDIPAGSIGAATAAFEARSGIHVTFAAQGIRALASAGASGLFTPDQAIEQILKDTGTMWHYTAAKAIAVELTKAIATVDVTDHAPTMATSMPKYSQPLTDTPQTVSVVPQAVIDQQNITTLRDTLRNVAGISLAAGEGGSQGDNLTIRGFTARNDLFIDGMRDFGSYYRDPFDVEEVEVLQGPSSVTFGRGSTGGVVNQASKTPSLNQFISGTLDVGSDETRRLTADINTPVNWLGKGAAFRLNVMGDENNVAERDVAENRRFGIAPSLSLGLGTPTRVTFSYLHEDADDTPDYGIPWLFNGPAPVDRTNYYGFRNANFLRTYDDIGTVKAEHDINSHLTLRNQARYANYLRDAQITEAQIPAGVTLATPLSSINVIRNEITTNSVESFLDDQLDLITTFRTGFIQHAVTTGVEMDRETSDPIRHTFTNVPTTSLLDPNPDQPFTGYTETVSSIVNTTANSVSGYVLDTMKLSRRWSVTGGIRWDRFDTHYTQGVAPASAFNRLDEMPTWRAALVYKPAKAGSIYLSSGTSFNPSAETLSLSAANANLPPEKNRTVEAGTKWDLPHDRLSFRAALFDTVKTNAREPDPDNPLLNVLAGDQRVRGLQLEESGRITKRWELRTSYAYLDGRVISSQYYPASVGALLANVPRNTFNIWNTWKLPGHWEAGGGASYVSSRTASSTVPNDPVTGLLKQVPGYWVFNAMIERPINEHVRLQANAYNLANRYYDELHPAHIVPGPGRSVLVGLKFRF